jgi:predicted amidophosphoribosyltransferase
MHPESLPAGAIRCSACGTVGYQTDRYCPCCGTSLARSCGNCGAPVVHPIAYYCTWCGSLLDAEKEKIQRSRSDRDAEGMMMPKG